MRIDFENKMLLRLMTFIPPFFGIVVFSYIVKFSHFENVNERLPLYQGISSYFSLILIGFTYIKNRNAIFGKKILLPLVVIFFLPLLGYYVAGMDVRNTILLVSVSFLSSIILYLLLVKKQMFNYLFYAIINSVLLPITLFVEVWSFIIIIVLLCITLFIIYNSIKKELVEFSYKNGGIDILNSIFLHSPYILFPFFDFLVQKAIGNQHYNDYVLINKYVNGGITLLFSYKQLSLVFSGELKKMNLIISILIGVLVVSAIGVSFNYYIIFVIMIALYSFGVNFSSLIIRSKLMTGVQFRKSLLGLLFVLLYFVSLIVFRDQISKNSNLFIFFMIIFTVIPSLLILEFKRKLN